MQSNAIIATGKVNSVDYVKGTVKVLFTDQSNSISTDLPMLNSEYKMPGIGDDVLCLFLSNGPEYGYCLGTYNTKGKLPTVTGEGVYYKELFGEAFIKYDRATGTLTLKAPKIVLEQEN